MVYMHLYIYVHVDNAARMAKTIGFLLHVLKTHPSHSNTTLCLLVFSSNPRRKDWNDNVDGRIPAPPVMYKKPVNNWISYLLSGVGFLPSTVLDLFHHVKSTNV